MTAVRVALVTGATGFIGRVLCQRLREKGVWVRALLRRPEQGPWDEIAQGALPNPLPAAAAAGVDTVFHLASRVHALAETKPEESEYFRVNLDGTRAVLAAAVAADAARFVYFSSVKASGEGGSECIDEDQPDRPQTAYGRSKLAAEEAVLAAGRQAALHAVCLRPAMVYGPGAKGNLTRMVQAVARGRFPPVPEIYNRRSMVHVEDVVQAALLAASAPRAAGRRYFVTDGQIYSTRQLYLLACRELGRPVPAWTVPLVVLRLGALMGDVLGRLRGRRFPIDSDALEKLTGSACYSCAKLVQDVGYHPVFALPQALPEIVAHLHAKRAV